MRHFAVAIFACVLLFSAVVHQSSAQTSANQVQHPPGGAFVEVNGSKLWYETEGSGEPLLLIAGGPGAAHYFHPYFSVLADSYRVICFDAFGTGKSDRAQSPREYSFERDVDNVEALRKALGLGKISVLGHSYGGMVAQAYAFKYPNSVNKLILADTLYSAEMWQAGNDSTNYEIQNQFPETWAKVQEIRNMGLHSSSKEHRKASDLSTLGLLYFHDASVAEHLPKDLFHVNLVVMDAIAGDDGDFLVGGDIASLDFRTRLKDLRMPVLVINGRYDRVCFPRFSLKFKQYAPQAELVMFEHSGHLPFIEEPDKFFALLRSFLGAKRETSNQH